MNFAWMQQACNRALCYGEGVTSLFPDDQPQARPTGVRVIAITCFVLAVFLIADGLLIALGILPLASGRYVLGEYTTMGVLIYFVVAAVLVLLGVGLLRGWSFSRRLAIAAAALFLATSAIPVSAAVTYFQIMRIVIHGAKIIVAIMAIRYLLQAEVVEYFSGRRG
jgi:hypothetical protein